MGKEPGGDIGSARADAAVSMPKLPSNGASALVPTESMHNRPVERSAETVQLTATEMRRPPLEFFAGAQYEALAQNLQSKFLRLHYPTLHAFLTTLTLLVYQKRASGNYVAVEGGYKWFCECIRDTGIVQVVYWECCWKRNGCPARATSTLRSKKLAVHDAHNHPPGVKL